MEKKIKKLISKKELQEIKDRKVKMQEQKNKLELQEKELRKSREQNKEKVKCINTREQQLKEEVQEKKFELQLIVEKLNNLPKEIDQLKGDLKNLKQRLEFKSKEKLRFYFLCLIFNFAIYFGLPAILQYFTTSPVFKDACFYVYDKLKNCYQLFTLKYVIHATVLFALVSANFVYVWIYFR